jgi:hypothetical protein
MGGGGGAIVYHLEEETTPETMIGAGEEAHQGSGRSSAI